MSGKPTSPPAVMTIAGSDPSGGAGLQADLKTFTALKVYGAAVVTAVTVQNTTGVFAVMEVPAATVAAQIEAVATDIPLQAVKIGMLASRANVEVVAAKLREYAWRNVVLDPLLRSTSGHTLLAAEAGEALRTQLAPRALVLTPNLDEAVALLGMEVRTVPQMRVAAARLHAWGPAYVFIKGGHLDGDAVDVLYDGREYTELRAARLPGRNTHGTGCVLSAAAAAYLARGAGVREALIQAKEFTRQAILRGLDLGAGAGPCDPVGVADHSSSHERLSSS